MCLLVFFYRVHWRLYFFRLTHSAPLSLSLVLLLIKEGAKSVIKIINSNGLNVTPENYQTISFGVPKFPLEISLIRRTTLASTSMGKSSTEKNQPAEFQYFLLKGDIICARCQKRNMISRNFNVDIYLL